MKIVEKDSYYYYRMGEECLNKKEIENAMEYFFISLKIKKHYKTYEKLYECCREINQNSIANYFIKLAYEENTKNDKVSLLYSRILIEENELKEAKEILLDILKRNPSYKQAKTEYDKICV